MQQGYRQQGLSVEHCHFISEQWLHEKARNGCPEGFPEV